MNKKTENIITTALKALENATGLKAGFKPGRTRNVDGDVIILVNKKKLKIPVEIRKELRQHQLQDLIEMHTNYPFLLVAERIFPALKEQLHYHKIGYLETAGNVYLEQGDVYLYVEGRKAEPQKIEKANRAFTKAGLRVLYQLLINEDAINWPYRELAKNAGVALGNINYVIAGLTEMGFILKANEKKLILTKKRELLDRWVEGYERTLKPDLFTEAYNFINPIYLDQWRSLTLDREHTLWGGEPAAEIMTEHLKPGQWTIYTEETKPALMKKYKLVPDPNGKVKVYRKFWERDFRQLPRLVNPVLVYADLMITRDPRCIETAKLIYKIHFDEKFR